MFTLDSQFTVKVCTAKGLTTSSSRVISYKVLDETYEAETAVGLQADRQDALQEVAFPQPHIVKVIHRQENVGCEMDGQNVRWSCVGSAHPEKILCRNNNRKHIMSSQQQPAAATPVDDKVTAPYEKSLYDVVTFLIAVGQTPTPAKGADITDSFRETFAGVVLSKQDPERLHNYVQKLIAIPGEHVAAVLASLNPTTRKYFHRIILELSEGVKDAMPTFGESVSILRLLIVRMLPAAAFLPEEAEFGTQNAVQTNFGLCDRVAQIIRPDEGNPKLQAMAKELQQAAGTQDNYKNLQDSYTELKDSFDGLTGRFKSHGFHLDAPEKDAVIITQWRQQYRATTVFLIIMLVIVLIAVVVMAIMLYKKRGSGNGIGGAAKVAAVGFAAGGGGQFSGFPTPALKFAYDNLE
jgi:hypothetical protein